MIIGYSTVNVVDITEAEFAELYPTPEIGWWASRIWRERKTIEEVPENLREAVAACSPAFQRIMGTYCPPNDEIGVILLGGKME